MKDRGVAIRYNKTQLHVVVVGVLVAGWENDELCGMGCLSGGD